MIKTFDSIREYYINRKIKYMCRKYNIRNYTINDDKSIDVDGYVDFSNNIIFSLLKIYI